MPTVPFAPRADLIDADLWMETQQTAAATNALWRLLDLSRTEPPQWMPVPVVCGPPGVGKTAVVLRFMRAAQRSVACDLVAERLRSLEPEQDERDRQARSRAEVWAAQMIRERGCCPGACTPAWSVPEGMLSELLAKAQTANPTVMTDMPPKPDMRGAYLGSTAWRSPGNKTGDPIRRTSLAFVDRADRLLNVSKAKRQLCLDGIDEFFGRVVRHRVIAVFVGSPELAEAVSECKSVQVIPLAPMPLGGEFGRVAEMIFGPMGEPDLARLHNASAGVIGRMFHIAGMGGLTPPYSIPDIEILRLPHP